MHGCGMVCLIFEVLAHSVLSSNPTACSEFMPVHASEGSG
jgi:hypothetical protein